jgi:hypothetical protein
MLENIVKRPALYWGNSANHLHSLMAFLRGYSLGRSDLTGPKAHLDIGLYDRRT